ncbi:Polysaccharide biosynthesis protein [uncultured archaeon]|nr:Polysaccharide biosynthesis protein [uncultured archaeon]
MSLVRKTTHGLFWVSFSTALLKIINFIITVILARLLEPEHFGLIAVGLIVINFFDLFRDMGIGAALIYKKDDMDKATNTAFFLFPVAAAIFYIVSYLSSPFISDFFNEPQVESIIKVLSLTFVIWSFASVPSALLDKNLEFKKKIIPQTLPKIGYGIIAISLALNGFGVWSIVIGYIVLQTLMVLTTWPLVGWRPSYQFDRKTAYELVDYGKQIVGANVIVFFISIIDVTFIGRILGVDDLGFYSIAMGIAGLLSTQVSGIMKSVMFPIYSTIQNDKKNLKKAYINTIKYVSIISIPASFGLYILASDFVKVLYSSKWLPAVAALQVLCFYGLNRSLLGTTENLYLAAGKPGVRTKLNLLQLVLMGALMYPLTMRYGIVGTSIAAMVPSLLIVFLTFREAGKIIDESFMYIARPLLPAIAGSFIMMFAIWGWQDISAAFSPILRLAVSVVLGAAVYVGYLWWARRELFYEIRELIGRK